jgi:anti-anti-sigma factor
MVHFAVTSVPLSGSALSGTARHRDCRAGIVIGSATGHPRSREEGDDMMFGTRRIAPGAPGPVVAIETHGHVVVLKARGDLAGDAAHGIADVMAAILERGPRIIIIELSEVEFIASAGLETVLHAHERAGTDTRIRLAAAEHLTALRSSALTDHLNSAGGTAIFSTLADALAAEG